MKEKKYYINHTRYSIVCYNNFCSKTHTNAHNKFLKNGKIFRKIFPLALFQLSFVHNVTGRWRAKKYCFLSGHVEEETRICIYILYCSKEGEE